VPTFADIEIDGQSRTAIRLLVEARPLGAMPSPTPSVAAILGLDRP
jgi:hypothetical protein